MKTYVKPVFEVAQVAPNEKIAATSCFKHGSCFWAEPECEPGWNYWSYTGPNPV